MPWRTPDSLHRREKNIPKLCTQFQSPQKLNSIVVNCRKCAYACLVGSLGSARFIHASTEYTEQIWGQLYCVIQLNFINRTNLHKNEEKKMFFFSIVHFYKHLIESKLELLIHNFLCLWKKSLTLITSNLTYLRTKKAHNVAQPSSAQSMYNKHSIFIDSMNFLHSFKSLIILLLFKFRKCDASFLMKWMNLQFWCEANYYLFINKDGLISK